MITLVRCNSNYRDFLDLAALLDEDLVMRYDEVQELYNQHNRLGLIDTVVVVYVDNNPAGCGCYKDFDDNTVEIKRLYVKPEYRGSGLAKAILLELEQWAREKGYSRATLETGIKQPEAIRFYTRQGYEKIKNYRQYEGNENSVCMSKKLQELPDMDQ
jgi:putative acetyltransferase